MRVHYVKKARKDYPDAGIKKGESYYWWKFRYGGIRRSKTPPTRQQLTQSEFLQQVYDIEDSIDDMEVCMEVLFGDSNEVEQEMETRIQHIVDEIEQLRDECQEKLDNMPEQLQETSDAGILLQERIDALDNWIDEIESIDTSIDENLSEEELEERVEEILEKKNLKKE